MPNDILAHELLHTQGAQPTRVALFLHGILGQGRNWRSFARRLVKELPDWGAVLVDLRAHGASQGLTPPDTLDSAAMDVERLRESLELPVQAVIGHSFGGKVALAWLARKPRDLRHVFVVDSLPGARPDRRGSEETVAVVDLLDRLPDRFDDRDDFRRHVTAAGFPSSLAQWLAQSLEPNEDGSYRFGLDLRRIRALLDDYFARDLWGVLEPPPTGVTAHLVIGGRSTVYSGEDRGRAQALAARYDTVHAHVLDADHWVHVEDPDGLHAVVAGALR